MRKRKRNPQGSTDALNPSHPHAPFGRDNGFHRMNELSELGATFEMTIYGGSFADCRASERGPERDLPKKGINVTKEVQQSIVSRSLSG